MALDATTIQATNISMLNRTTKKEVHSDFYLFRDDESYELEGEEGIILNSGRFGHHHMIQQNQQEYKQDLDAEESNSNSTFNSDNNNNETNPNTVSLIQQPQNQANLDRFGRRRRTYFCVRLCNSFRPFYNINRNLSRVYWIFTKPTEGLIRRNLDAGKLHDEINQLNMLSQKLYGAQSMQLKIFIRIFVVILMAFVAVGITFIVFGTRGAIGDYLLSKQEESALISLGNITALIAIIMGFCSCCLVDICSQRRAKKAKQELIDYVMITLNEKYNDDHIAWEFVEDWNQIENANIVIKCIPISSEMINVDLQIAGDENVDIKDGFNNDDTQ